MKLGIGSRDEHIKMYFFVIFVGRFEEMNLLRALVWAVVLNVDHVASGLISMGKTSCATATNWAFPTKYILHKSDRRNVSEATLHQGTIPFGGELDPTKEVIFTVHGFLHGCKYPFSNSTAEAYLKNVPEVQVVNVCWSASMSAVGKRMGLYGAVFFPSSVTAVRCVGYSVAQFLKRLHNEIGLPWKKMTMVSHSLGCYLAGYAGVELNGKIGKQIGIDPARKTFTWARSPFRRNSGQQVIVLHTSVFGDFRERGTVDFYANNGIKQPACAITGTIHSADHKDPIMCSHQIAYTYFKTSLAHPKAFRATKCDSYKHLTAHKCDDNPKTYFSPYTNTTGRYYFPTTDKPPYYRSEEEITWTVKTKMGSWWKIWNHLL